MSPYVFRGPDSFPFNILARIRTVAESRPEQRWKSNIG